MNIDPELMFECLMYLNVYYYPMFAISESIMALAKYRSIVSTPDIGRDASVTFACLFFEIAKILVFRKFKDKYRDLSTVFAMLLTVGTLMGAVYVFCIQDPTLILEKILNVLMTMLAVTEIVFGFLQVMPCFKKNQLY